MVLEPPSDLTLETKRAMEEKTLQPSSSDITFVGPSTSTVPPRKKKGPKGPNPLSVKKKKKLEEIPVRKPKADSMQSATKAGDKRKRDDEHEPDSASVAADSLLRSKKRRRRKKTGLTGEDAEH
ncbi:hypothetical protein H0H81_003748 [Sphagnurus paluster]|uniref:UTP23 sensor motif region domain-containing protein n=1 Tax=Sphagnurus paluster TaxID=117069 RepID=A0A9P7GSS5_9AGAR|nr:hypothetical protein H0H81_003748 [Sphagnurus paluster]